MKKYLNHFLFIILIPIVLSSCGAIDFPDNSGNNLKKVMSLLSIPDGSGHEVIPADPSSLNATTASSSQINLSWTDNSNNETGFIIQRSTNNILFTQIDTVSSNTTTYINTNLSASTLYYYRVLAYNGAGNSGYCEDSETTYAPPITGPDDPSSLTAIAASSSQINLSWTDNSNNEKSFIIERSLTSGSGFSEIHIAAAGVTSWNDTGLTASTTYFYRVRAHNTAGYSGYSNEASVTTPDPAVTLSGGTSIPEAAGTVTITATLSGASGLAVTVTLSYSGTATLTNDYTRTGTSITIPAGNTTGSVTVTAVQDTNDEDNETVIIDIASVTNGTESETQRVTTTIIDDDGAAPSSAIIADHTIVSRYSAIPDGYIAAVKSMLLLVPGESHSRAYTRGLELLAQENSRYNCLISEPPNGTGKGSSLRASNYYYNADYEGGKYKGTCSEQEFWSSSTNITTASNMILQSIIYQRDTANNPVSAIGFGWCWDMAFSNYQSPSADPTYGVHWFGATDGELGTTPGAWWGLDSGDSAINMDTYIAVIQALMQADAGTRVFFTTGPVDSSWCQGESGYQTYIKHQYLRDKVALIDGAVLFDFADILAYNDSNELNTESWNGHEFPFIHPDNMGSDSPDYHFGQTGAKRLAKAMWWMLARIAGWDGN